MYLVTQKIVDDHNQQYLVELQEWFSELSFFDDGLDKHHSFHNIFSFSENSQIQLCLEQLEILCQTKVDFKIFVDFFKTINLMTACPLTRAVFNLKIKPLYRIFKELPLILFNEQTCKELAIHTPFFPSAHDIDQIMSKHMKRAQQNIGLLQQIIQQKQN